MPPARHGVRFHYKLVRCCTLTKTMSPRLRRQENISGYLFLLPSLVFFLGFVIYPMAMCIWTSFTDANMNSICSYQLTC